MRPENAVRTATAKAGKPRMFLIPPSGRKDVTRPENKAWKKKKADVTFEKKIENAVRKSLEKAKKDDVILAFGSLSFLGEIVKALDTIRSEV